MGMANGGCPCTQNSYKAASDRRDTLMFKNLYKGRHNITVTQINTKCLIKGLLYKSGFKFNEFLRASCNANDFTQQATNIVGVHYW